MGLEISALQPGGHERLGVAVLDGCATCACLAAQVAGCPRRSFIAPGMWPRRGTMPRRLRTCPRPAMEAEEAMEAARTVDAMKVVEVVVVAMAAEAAAMWRARTLLVIVWFWICCFVSHAVVNLKVTRPLRGSVSCGSGWSVHVFCVSIQLTLSQVLANASKQNALFRHLCVSTTCELSVHSFPTGWLPEYSFACLGICVFRIKSL